MRPRDGGGHRTHGGAPQSRHTMAHGPRRDEYILGGRQNREDSCGCVGISSARSSDAWAAVRCHMLPLAQTVRGLVGQGAQVGLARNRFFFFVFFSHLFDVRKVQVPVQPANYRPRRLGAGGDASCSTSASGGCCAPGRAPATYGAPSSVAASVLCRATLKNPHQRRSQACLVAGRRAARTRIE